MEFSTPGLLVLHYVPVCSNSCLLSLWHCSTASSSVVPFFSSCFQSFPASVFSNESALCIRWPKYWSFSFSISPSNGYSGLISFRIYWFNILSVQETLKSILYHHSLKASILWCSAFFMVKLSHPYMTIWKNHIALTKWNLVGKVKSQLCNTLSRFVMLFFQGASIFLISWLQSLSTVILEPKKIKSVTVSIVSPSVCYEVMAPDAVIFAFFFFMGKTLFQYSL